MGCWGMIALLSLAVGLDIVLASDLPACMGKKMGDDGGVNIFPGLIPLPLPQHILRVKYGSTIIKVGDDIGTTSTSGAPILEWLADRTLVDGKTFLLIMLDVTAPITGDEPPHKEKWIVKNIKGEDIKQDGGGTALSITGAIASYTTDAPEDGHIYLTLLYEQPEVYPIQIQGPDNADGTKPDPEPTPEEERYILPLKGIDPVTNDPIDVEFTIKKYLSTYKLEAAPIAGHFFWKGKP